MEDVGAHRIHESTGLSSIHDVRRLGTFGSIKEWERGCRVWTSYEPRVEMTKYNSKRQDWGHTQENIILM